MNYPAMLTLGNYVKQLRGEKSQQQIAHAVGVDHSLVSFIEADKPVRMTSLKKICRKGLKVSDDDWQMIKLLWLQQQSGESVFTKTMTKARESLNERSTDTTQEFIDKVEDGIRQNMDLISKERLQILIVSIFTNRKLLSSLRQYYEVFKALDPKSRS
jgi:transcriptional regulator with XRE-family HTH domain